MNAMSDTSKMESMQLQALLQKHGGKIAETVRTNVAKTLESIQNFTVTKKMLNQEKSNLKTG